MASSSDLDFFHTPVLVLTFIGPRRHQPLATRLEFSCHLNHPKAPCSCHPCPVPDSCHRQCNRSPWPATLCNLTFQSFLSSPACCSFRTSPASSDFSFLGPSLERPSSTHFTTHSWCPGALWEGCNCVGEWWWWWWWGHSFPMMLSTVLPTRTGLRGIVWRWKTRTREKFLPLSSRVRCESHVSVFRCRKKGSVMREGGQRWGGEC